jgi:hypothetical protein
MVKNALAQLFVRASDGGRRYSRAPTDVGAPSAPVLADPVANTTFIDVAWVNGVDAETGIKETLIEYRVNGTATWIEFSRVAYPDSVEQIDGLIQGTPYDIGATAYDNAGNASARAVKTVSTLGTSADLEPGTLAVGPTTVTVNEGTAFNIPLVRSGAGISSPIVEADWQFTGFSEGTPSPANGTVQFGSAVNGVQQAASTAGVVSADRSGVFRIAAVRALSGVLQPSLGNSQATVTIKNVGASTGVRWHPGHGVFLGNFGTADDKGYQDSWIEELESMANVKHVLGGFYWGAIETALGVYDFTLIENFVTKCALHGKKAIIWVQDRVFSSGSIQFQIDEGRLPAYIQGLIPTGGYFSSTTQSLVAAKLYYAAPMARLIALQEALANRYNNDARVEGVFSAESSLPANGIEGFSHSAYLAQWKLMVTALAEQWTKTNVFLGMNSGFGTDALRIDALQHAVANRMLLSGPDIHATADTYSLFQRIYLGLVGGVDYRSQMACGFQVQGPNLGGNHTPSTMDPDDVMDAIYDKAKPAGTLKCSYVIWLRKTFNFAPDTNDVQWNHASYPKIKTWLEQSAASIPLLTTMPGNYTAINTA